MFARAEAGHPGAAKGSRGQGDEAGRRTEYALLISGHGPVQGVFLADRADVMLGYRSGSGAVMQEIAGLTSVALPSSPTVGPGRRAGRAGIARWPPGALVAPSVLEAGQMILQRHGFDPVISAGN